jgi:hypothetical protein
MRSFFDPLGLLLDRKTKRTQVVGNPFRLWVTDQPGGKGKKLLTLTVWAESARAWVTVSSRAWHAKRHRLWCLKGSPLLARLVVKELWIEPGRCAIAPGTPAFVERCKSCSPCLASLMRSAWTEYPLLRTPRCPGAQKSQHEKNEEYK